MNDVTDAEKPPVTVYTTRTCTYCTAAKRLLHERGVPFEEVDLTQDAALRMRLSEENDGYRTVPMIFVEGRFIGGFRELTALDRRGGLAALSHEK